MGYHLVGEVDLAPAGTPLTLSLLGYYANWNLNLARAYTNGVAIDISTAHPGADGWAIRTRIDWRDALKLGRLVGISPYLAYTHSHTGIDAYTETGGGFPMTVAKSRTTGDESRLGATAGVPVAGLAQLAVSGEWVHRFDSGAFAMSGAMVGGLAPFTFATVAQASDWGRVGLDLNIRTSAASLLSLSGHAVGGGGRDADLSGSVSFRVGF